MIRFRPGGSRTRGFLRRECTQVSTEASTSRTSVVHLGQELLKVLHGSELGADGAEVLHVVAKVPHRGAIQRTDPHRLDVQVLEVIQLL